MSLQDTKSSKSLTMGTSPFVTNAKFKIIGFKYEMVENSKQNYYPVFDTTLGTLAVQSLLRTKAVKPYVDKETGEQIMSRTPDGTLSHEIRAILAENRGKTNDEVLPILVDKLKDRECIVRLREYITIETQYGDRAVPLAHIDIAQA